MRGVSQSENFEGVEALLAASDNYQAAEETITDSGYCLNPVHHDYLRDSASRVAVLKTLSEMGVVSVASSDRYRLAELAKELRSFR